MQDSSLTRRDVLTRALPAAAALGAGMLSLSAIAQQAGAPPAAPPGGPAAQKPPAPLAGGQYLLPALPYPLDALEPHISAKILEIHHDKHHKAYIDGLNKAVKAVLDLQQTPEIDPARLAGLQRDLSFNGGGHFLHTLFWDTMAPKAGGAPQGALAQAINAAFGSFDAFKNYFSKVAAGIKGSGWALLAYEPMGDRLVVFAVNEHDAHLIPSAIALLPLDVWEHAYYLQYQNLRADFIKAWWNLVNWPAVGEAYNLFYRLVHSTMQ